ncbi:hypothetical protein PFICI_11863 [Pestalotiopsis fici W106-1]|uniref:Major facilitator superfamily (MFS) profile domain-containing protein n=1 Tax=Pestalotiopsis fici (strain W106-1 / CGMCC3.15140) TaxID=1229662 RepID=W3WUD6_PESFW|nr:uncharacterized protein PFICI_11863 [Pestalotiopsis fici W106-1]ETS76476.1 hypothetical protein PFICI_11863 [Pestalotiopsis fici W106-1]
MIKEAPSTENPLHMSRLRKELYFVALIYGASVTGVVGPVLVPGFSLVAASLNVGLTQVTLLNGALIMALGVSAYICAPLAEIYGRRIAYLVTSLMLVFSCVWGGFAKTYGSLLASRTFQGLGMGGFFSLAGTVSINDLFPVNERGRRAGIWNFAVIVSVNVAPVISSYIITALGWQWSFKILAIAFALAFILVVFFVPETLPNNNVVDDHEMSRPDASSIALRKLDTEVGMVQAHPTDGQDVESPRKDGANQKILERNLLTQQPFLRPPKSACNGLVHQLFILVAPLRLLRHPIIIWACAMWSVTFSWTIIQGAVADQIFEAEPYNLSATSVGLLIGVPPLIGSAFGTILGGYLCDLLARMMAFRNGGIYEPEFRLPVLIPGMITTAIGSYGLGIVLDRGLSVWASAVLLGCLNFGVGMNCTSIVAYTNDACEEKTAEAFGVAMLVKSVFAFGLTFILNDYYIVHGALAFFVTWGSLTAGVTLLTIPLYLYGKRLRVKMAL